MQATEPKEKSRTLGEAGRKNREEDMRMAP
jgi:hypothetical protein